MEPFMNKIQMIYERMADETSQNIFANRLAYGLTENLDSMRNIIRTAPGGKIFLDRLGEAVSAERKICIFGSGIWGRSILESNPDVKFFCFIDNNEDRCGKRIGGGASYTF